MVTVKISGGLRPETVCCCACTWTDVSSGDKIQRNCKGLKINVYMCSWGKLWTRYTETRNPSATSEEPGAKAGYCACPLHSTSSRGWADHLSHPASLNPAHLPTLILSQESAHAPPRPSGNSPVRSSRAGAVRAAPRPPLARVQEPFPRRFASDPSGCGAPESPPHRPRDRSRQFRGSSDCLM